MLHVSRYTFFFRSSTGLGYVYSTRTGSLISLSDSLFEILTLARESGQIAELGDRTLRNSLAAQKILVAEGDDDLYLQQLLFQTLRSCYAADRLGYVIALTSECNFRCFYCFEPKKRPVTMSQATIDRLIEFTLQHHTAHPITIIWYGGEPLLAKDVIRNILERFELEGFRLSRHEIITNGYHFDEEAIALFSRYPLGEIQITLDGDRDRHDAIRKDYRTGAGSFETIVRNTQRILRELPDTLVSIRVNVDRRNRDSYMRLRNEIADMLGKGRYTIYPGILRTDNEQGDELGGHALGYDERADFATQLIRCGQMRMHGELRPGIKSCMAGRMNNYIVGAEGELYKCWNDVTNPAKRVGSIHAKHVENQQLLMDYHINSQWFEDPQCRACFLLPICSGGCQWYRVRNLREGGRFDHCTLFKRCNLLQASLESLISVGHR